MRRPTDLLRAAVLGLAIVTPAAAAPAAPDPVQLLDQAYAGPARPYEGRVILTRWSADRSTSEEANVFFSPPSRYRLEFLSPDGSVNRVVVGDGQRQEIELVKEGRSFTGTSDDALTPRQRDDERRLLLANYKVSFGGAENVMGRPTWIVDLTPAVAGKPAQRMWIDRETRAVLATRRTLASEKTGASSRFTQFETKSTLPASLFAGVAAPAIEKSKSDRKAETTQVSAARPTDPARLLGGFALRDADLFDVKGATVRHLRYTDGLIPISLFVTRAPVDSAGIAPASAESPQNLLSTPVQVNQWKDHGNHYTLVGEVSPELLKQMSAPTGK